MKIEHRFILTATLGAALGVLPLFADDQPGAASPVANTNTSLLPAAPGHTAKKKKAPAAKKEATGTAKKAAASEPLKPRPAVAPGPAVAAEKNVNVRGQAAINSEVVAHLKKGDHVNVLEIVAKKPKPDEPDKWAKVNLPANTMAWVNGSFINAADKTVKPKKLNVRSGPGENYSVIARITNGTVVKEIESKGDWMKIEAPADAYGFIAAHLLVNEAAAPAPPPPMVAVVEPPKPPPTETKLEATPTPPAPAEPIVPTATPPAAPPPTPPATAPVTAPAPAEPAPAVVTTPTAPATPPPPAEEVLVKRVVSREGIVKRSVSIQAPTYFALESLDTGKTIDYLYSSSTNLVLKDFRGKRIVVTGEEMLDERWPNTPVINVDSLEAVP
jgi:uncharacterized protein YgiM (DUF1202 family)